MGLLTPPSSTDPARAVLIVEDEPAIRRLFSATLEGAGYETLRAATVFDALAVLADHPVDAVVLDVNLPGMSGLELLDHLGVAFPETVVAVVTAEGDRGLASEAAERGADVFLRKPVAPDQLVATVDAALARGGRRRFAQDMAESTVGCLVRLAGIRDRGTGQHSGRMSRFCSSIGRGLGLDESDVLRLQLASVLHDIGKVAIPDAILHKPGPLSAEERRVVETHTTVGFTVLSGFGHQTLELAAVIAHEHHERCDGSGYPRGLVGEEIALEARIAAVADVFDALTSVRPYRPSASAEDALELIARGRGTLFDADVVDAAVESPEFRDASRVEAGDLAYRTTA